MVVRMRQTKSKTRSRRSHQALKEAPLARCTECGNQHIAHRVCMTCGMYRGRQVVDVKKQEVKKAEKRKQREKNETASS